MFSHLSVFSSFNGHIVRDALQHWHLRQFACTFGSWHVWSMQASFLLPRIGQLILAWPNIDMCYFLTHYSRLILATGWIELFTCTVETTRPEQSNVRCGKRCKWYSHWRPSSRECDVKVVRADECLMTSHTSLQSACRHRHYRAARPAEIAVPSH